MNVDVLVERLAAIEEELRDLAYERLREAAARPDSDESNAAAADEKRINQARRAVVKAMQALGGLQEED
jgi:hypothetical protein